ncbi:MAG TPA: cysteine--tRNA ligase [Ktedonobacterales bacterium]
MSTEPNIRLHNTASGSEEPFEPYGLPVKMYVCGLTPKDEPHLGHARQFVVKDMVRRYLTFRGYPVRYVQNFTDIDDKIIAAGLREGIAPAVAAKRYTESYFRELDRLNVLRADEYTYVTEYIARIIEMISGLIADGHAYAEENGDVFFSVPSFPAYGKLSGRDSETLSNEARIDPDERKHDPRDFALWKAAKPGEPWWESPWGKGRPGWHIECSTMALHALGKQIDIHGGGTDLIFPHHENEIAQSESYTGKHPFVKYWVHSGLLNLSGDKMAHSGEFMTITTVLDEDRIPAPALRTYLLSQHYRTIITWSEEQLQAIITRWRRWVDARANLNRLIDWAAGPIVGAVDAAVADALATAHEAFITAMDDDLNTSVAMAVLDDLVRAANTYIGTITGDEPTPEALGTLLAARDSIDSLADILGIELVEEEDEGSALSADDVSAIEDLVGQRTAARAVKNWAEADRIRKVLLDGYDVEVKDTPQGPTWSVRATVGERGER